MLRRVLISPAGCWMSGACDADHRIFLAQGGAVSVPMSCGGCRGQKKWVAAVSVLGLLAALVCARTAYILYSALTLA
jgi:hypothetical protein